MERKNETREGAAIEAVEKLRADGYFREGEQSVLVLPKEGQKWVAKYETTALSSPSKDEARSKRFPPGDHLYDALVAAGYRVEVDPNFEAMTSDVDAVDYLIFTKE